MQDAEEAYAQSEEFEYHEPGPKVLKATNADQTSNTPSRPAPRDRRRYAPPLSSSTVAALVIPWTQLMDMRRTEHHRD